MATTGSWQSAADCLAGLSSVLDAGGYARADAYAYLYGRLEATADLEETPAELRGVVGAQHGPTLVQHIAGALRAAIPSPVEHAEQASKYLPLLTVLLSHECCCRALDAQQQQSVGAAAAGGVLDTLLDVLLAGQEKLAAIKPPSASSSAAAAGPSTSPFNSPPPSSASAAGGGNPPPPLPAPPAIAASSSSSPGGSIPLAEREARVIRLPLADLCLHLLDALAYQRCDLSRLPDRIFQKLVRAMALAVDGDFGPLCQTLPAQGLHAAIRLLPRIAPLPSAATTSRGLLKAILRRALAVPNVAEAGMAVDALRGAVQAGLLKRDPMGSRQAETYHRCVTDFWNEKAYERLKEADPITALRLTGVLMQVLDPADVDNMGKMMKTQLWPTISGFLHTREEAKTARALQREAGASIFCAADVWISYVTALVQQWPSLDIQQKGSLKRVVRFLGIPYVFTPLYRTPSEGTMELELQMLALLNTLLAMTEWRKLLWPSPDAGGAQPRHQKQKQQAGGEQQQQQQADLQHVVLTLLRTDHSGEKADLRMRRFDAGLACLSELVPGAIPPTLLLLQDASLRGWRPVAPLDEGRQLSLLSAAIPILANQSALLRHFELEAEAVAARRHHPPQSQLESADATTTATAMRPPLEQWSPTLRPLLVCWAYLLQRLLPTALAHATNPAAAAAIVDGALGVLGLAPKTAAQLAALQLLADEALAILGPSQLAVPPGSTLWAAVTGKVYTAPPGGQEVRLGTLALGCKALLINQEALATMTTTAPAAPLRLPVGDGGLVLPQVVEFLDGLLARLVTTTGPQAADPSPWLRMSYACLAVLLTQPSRSTTIASAALNTKEAHALTLRVLRMLPTFATHGGPAAAFDSHDALRAAAGGPVLDLWSNLLGRCLTWAEAPHAHTHAAAAAASSQSQSQLAGWETEDPTQAIKAVADAVLAPLLPPAAAPTSSRALAVLWCPLAWRALRCLNTSLNQRSRGRSTEAQRIRAALLAPALRLAAVLLSALQPSTAQDRGAKAPCLCNDCGPTASSSSGNSSAGGDRSTWLSICLRPAPAAEEWTLESVEAMAQALAAWWCGKGAAIGTCRTALAKEAANATRRFLDSLVQGVGGGKSGGTRRQMLGGGGAAAASQSLLQADPGDALLALQPLLLALLAEGGDEGKACVQVLWQGAGMGKRTDLGLVGVGAQALRGALQQLVRSGAIASLDPTLGGAGTDPGGLTAASNGNSGSGRRMLSSGSSGGPPVVKKRPSWSSSSSGGWGAAEGASASKRAK